MMLLIHKIKRNNKENCSPQEKKNPGEMPTKAPGIFLPILPFKLENQPQQSIEIIFLAVK